MSDNQSFKEIVYRHLQTELLQSELIYAGGMNHVYKVTIPGSTIMLKVFPASRRDVAVNEAALLQLAAQNKINVPNVLASGTLNEFGYFLYTAINGHPLNFDLLNVLIQSRLAQTLVEDMFTMAAIPVGRNGNISELEERFDSWLAFLDYNVDEGLEHLKRNLDLPVTIFSEVKQFMTHYRPAQSKFEGLVWGDLKQENILLAPDNNYCLLDFESSFSGDPILSLGYLFAREGNSPFYRSIAHNFHNHLSYKETDVYFYALFRLLRISKHLTKPLPTGLPRLPVLTYFTGINQAINIIQSL